MAERSPDIRPLLEFCYVEDQERPEGNYCSYNTSPCTERTLQPRKQYQYRGIPTGCEVPVKNQSCGESIHRNLPKQTDIDEIVAFGNGTVFSQV